MSLEKDHQLFREEKLRFIEEYRMRNPARSFKYIDDHRLYRYLVKKFRRKLSRQSFAKERDEKFRLEKEERDRDPLYQAWIHHQEELREEREIEEQQRNEKARRLWEEKEAMIMQKIRLRQIQKEKETRVASDDVAPTHNPFIPVPIAPAPSIERPMCSFYLKTGVCRYDYRCHRSHPKPDITDTLLAVNMYSNFEMQHGLDDEYDCDIGLEFEESERYENFKEFYVDVLPEFEKFGPVIRFLVCTNVQTHLRGNVYVQYETEDQAMKAYLALNSRYYAGRMVQCQFVHIRSWSAAICGLSQRGKCSKGRRCNYLHVFRNPLLNENRSERRSEHQTKRRKTHQ